MKRSLMIGVALATLTSFLAPAFAAETRTTTQERPGMSQKATPGQKAIVKHKVKKQAVKKQAVKKHAVKKQVKKSAVKKHIKTQKSGTTR